ncbi:MAG: SDR family NAD(P)-dependent oxidoreductase [Deltaproteobacteria bacterium]|nr:SDR family NAD(P)-dependent oxidoreductase [Deltaproteobacteria bacterium]
MSNQDDSPLILVTGATDGIGKQTAIMLAERGARVIVHGRSPERTAAAAEDVARSAGTPWVGQASADLSSLAEIHAMSEQILATYDRLDVLINNAGVFMRERMLTRDGFEATYAVNYLAPFTLSHLLLPHLKRSASGRVINVSSNTHIRCRFDWDNLQGEREWDDSLAYASSKLALVLFSVELARRTAAHGIKSNALHPGVVSTKLLKEGFGIEGLDSAEKGSATSVYLALAEEGGRVTGKYFVEGMATRCHPLAGDPLTTSKFYERTAAMVGLPGLPRPGRPAPR